MGRVHPNKKFSTIWKNYSKSVLVDGKRGESILFHERNMKTARRDAIPLDKNKTKLAVADSVSITHQEGYREGRSGHIEILIREWYLDLHVVS